MTVSMYSSSVPVLQQLLGSLSTILARAQAHAGERKIDADAYLQARLFPDMFPLLRQVQIACDFAKASARAWPTWRCRSTTTASAASTNCRR